MRQLPIVLTALAVLAVAPSYAEDKTAKDHKTAEGTRARADDMLKGKEVTYGRVKELTPGQKVVIDVDNSIDKTFELDDNDLSVTMAKGLKVGDTVKVKEHEVAGKAKSVTITKHSGGGVVHGDKDPAAKKP